MMPIPPPFRRAPSKGFVLPFVLLALAAVSVLTFALTAEGLQSVRAVHGAQLGEDGGHAADLAMADALAAFSADSVWLVPPGVSHTRTIRLNDLPVVVEWRRTQPLVASVRATVQYRAARRSEVTYRDHFRAVWLAPPPLAVAAALATNGPVAGREGTLVSGADQPVPGSPCGMSRDTASVIPLVATQVTATPAGSWPGAPLAMGPSPGLLADVHRAVNVIDGRLPAVPVTSVPRSLPPSRPWAAISLRGDTVTVTGPVRFSGLLLVRGSAVFTGAIQVTGLIIVLGPLDASGAQFSVQGAVLATDTSARGVMLGAQSRLFYDRCAVQMALAAVARPSLAPFSLWHSLPR